MPTKTKKGSISTKPSSSLNWFKNVGKSLGYASTDLISQMIPASSEFITSNADTAKQLAYDIKNARSTGKKVIDGINNIPQVGIGRDALKNAVKDIKSGKIYNKERQDAIFDEGNDFDFEDMELTDDFNYDDTDDSSSSTKNITVNKIEIPQVKNNPMIDAVQKQTSMMISTAQSINETNIALSANSLMVSSKLGTSMVQGLESINTNLGLLVNFQSDSMSKYIGASLKYYEDNLRVLGDTLAELKRGNGSSEPEAVRQKEDPMDKALLAHGGLNVKGYIDVVKKNIGDTIDSNMFLAPIKMVLEDKDTLKFLAASPLSFIATKIVTGLVPGMLKHAMEDMDKSFQNFFPALLMKVNRMAFKSDNPLMQILGQVFGVNVRTKSMVDLSKYNKGAVPFDGYVKKSITDVIPGYLRKILAVISGKEEMGFDYEKGKFTSVKEMSDNYKREKDRNILNNFSDAMSEIKGRAEAIQIENEKDRKEFMEDIDKFFVKLGKTNYLVNPLNERDSHGNKVDELSDVHQFRSVDMQRFFRQLVLSLPKNMQMKMFGADVVDARRAQEKFITDVENNPLLHNVSTIESGLGFDQHIKRDKDTGKFTVRKGGIGGTGIDKFGKSLLDYARDIKKILLEGLITFPRQGGPTSTYSGYGPVPLNPVDVRSRETQSKLDKMTAEESKWRRDNTKRTRAYDRYTEEQKRRMIENGQTYVESSIDLSTSSDSDLKNKIDSYVLNRDARAEDKGNNIATWAGKFLKGSTQDKYNMIKQKISDVLNKPVQLLTSVFRKIDDSMYKVIFGGKDEPGSSFIGATLAGLKTQFEKFGNFMQTKILNPLKEAIFGKEGLVTKLKDSEFYKNMKVKMGVAADYLFGKPQGENGKREGGLFSDTANEMLDMWDGAKYYFTGKAYTNRAGVSFVQNDKSVFGEMKSMFRGFKDNMKTYLFGKKDAEGHQEQTGILTGVINSVKDGFNNFSDAIFGPKKFNGKDNKYHLSFEAMNKKIKERAPKALAWGMVGAGSGLLLGGKLGLLGALFMPGGPIGGAIVGTTLGFLSQSDRFKDWLFGPKDAEGTRIGGVMSKSTQEFLKKNKAGIVGGATVGAMRSILGFGLLPSFFLPGGPIGGAIMGMGASMLYRSNAVQNFLFGKIDPADPDGKRMGGIFQKMFGKLKGKGNTFGNVGAGIIGGAGLGLVTSKLGILGAMMVPGGPIGGAILGTAAGIALSSEKWKKALFGEWDEDTQKRKGGLFGKFTNWFNLEVVAPLKLKLGDIQLNMGEWFQKSIANPFRDAIEPLKTEFRLMVDNLKKMFVEGWQRFTGFIGNVFEKYVGMPFGKFMNDKVMKPIKGFLERLVGGIGKVFGSILASPFKALNYIAQGARSRQEQRGVDKMRENGWNDITDVKGRRERGEKLGLFSTRDKDGNKVGKGFFGRVGGMYFSKQENENARYGAEGASYAREEDARIQARNKKQDEHFSAKRAEQKAKWDELNRRRSIGSKVDYDNFSYKPDGSIAANVSRIYDNTEKSRSGMTDSNLSAPRQVNDLYRNMLGTVDGDDVNKFDTTNMTSKDKKRLRRAMQLGYDPEAVATATNNRMKNKDKGPTPIIPENAPLPGADSTTQEVVKSNQHLSVIQDVITKISGTVDKIVTNVKDKVKSIPKPQYQERVLTTSFMGPMPLDATMNADINQGRPNTIPSPTPVVPVTTLNDNNNPVNKTTEKIVNNTNMHGNTDKEPQEKESKPTPVVKAPKSSTSDLQFDSGSFSSTRVKDLDRYPRTKGSLLSQIAFDVRNIAKEVNGQLDGVGKNVYQIRKLTQKQANVSDEDLTGSANRDRIGFLGRIRRMFYAPLDSIKEFFLKKVQWVSEKLHAIGQGIANVTKAILNVPVTIAKGLFTFSKAIIKNIGEAALNISKVPLILAKGINTGLQIVLEGAKAIGPAIGETLVGAAKLFSGAMGMAKESMIGFGKGVGELLFQVGKGTGELLVKFGSTAFGLVNTLGKTISKTFTLVTGFTLDVIKGAGELVIATTSNLTKFVFNTVKTVGEKLIDVGNSLFEIVTSPIKFLAGAIGKFVGFKQEVIVKGGYLDSVGKVDSITTANSVPLPVVKRQVLSSDEAVSSGVQQVRIVGADSSIPVYLSLDKVKQSFAKIEPLKVQMTGDGSQSVPVSITDVDKQAANYLSPDKLASSFHKLFPLPVDLTGGTGKMPSSSTTVSPVVTKPAAVETPDKIATPSLNDKLANSVMKGMEAFDSVNDKEEAKKKSDADKKAKLDATNKEVKKKNASFMIAQHNAIAEQKFEKGWKSGLYGMVSQIANDTREHKKDWADIFGKKGIIALALLAALPLIKKLLDWLLGKGNPSRTDANGNTITNSDLVEHLIVGAGKSLKEIWEKLGKRMGKEFEELGKVFRLAGQKVEKMMQPVIEKIEKVTKPLVDALSKTFKDFDLKKEMRTLRNDAIIIKELVKDSAKDLLEKTEARIAEIPGKVFEGAKNLGSKFIDKILPDDKAEAIKKFFRTTRNDMFLRKELAKDAINGVTSKIENGAEVVKGAITVKIDSVKDLAKAVQDNVSKQFRTMRNDLTIIKEYTKDGIKDGAEAVKNGATKARKAAKDFIMPEERLNSIQDWIKTAENNMGELKKYGKLGIQEALEDFKGGIVNATESFKSLIPEKVKTELPKAFESTRLTLSSINSKIDDLLDKAIPGGTKTGDATQVVDDVTKNARKEGNIVTRTIDKLSQKFGGDTTKVSVDTSLDSVNESRISKFIDIAKQAVDRICEMFTGKFPAAKGASEKILKILGNVLVPSKLVKYLPKISKGLAKIAGSVFSAGLSDAAFFTWGAGTGLFEAAHLFKVDGDQTDWIMDIISSGMKGLLNVSWFFVIEILNDICVEITDVDFIQIAATEIYKAVTSEEKGAKLEAAQANFRAEKDAYNQANGTTLSLDAYNDKQNKTVGQKIYDNVISPTVEYAKKGASFLGDHTMWGGLVKGAADDDTVRKNLSLGDDQDITMWDRIKSAGAQGVSGATFGLVSGQQVADGAAWLGNKAMNTAQWAGQQLSQGASSMWNNSALGQAYNNFNSDDAVKNTFNVSGDGQVTTGMRVASGITTGLNALTGGNLDTEGIAKTIYGMETSTQDFFKSISDTCSKTWQGVTGWISKEGDNISQNAKALWGDITSLASKAWQGASKWVSDQGDIISNNAHELWGQITTYASKGWDAVSGYVNDNIEGIKKDASVIWDALPGPVKDAWKNAGTAITDAANSISESASSKWDDAAKYASETWKGIKEKIGKGLDYVINIYDRIANYFGSKWEAVKKFFGGKADAKLEDQGFNSKDDTNGDDENPKASGMDNVPYDGYRATLHQGEMIIPAAQSNMLRSILGQPQVQETSATGPLNSTNTIVNSLPSTDDIKNANSKAGDASTWTGVLGNIHDTLGDVEQYEKIAQNLYSSSKLGTTTMGKAISAFGTKYSAMGKALPGVSNVLMYGSALGDIATSDNTGEALSRNVGSVAGQTLGAAGGAALGSLLGPAGTAIGTYYGTNIGGQIGSAVGDSVYGIGSDLSNGKTITEALDNNVVNPMLQFFSGVGKSISDSTDGIMKSAGDIWNNLSTTVSQGWDSASKFVTDSVTTIGNDASNAWTTLTTDTSTTWNDLSSNATQIWSGLTTDTSKIWDDLSKNGSKIWSDFSSGSSTSWTDTISDIKSAWGDVQKDINTTLGDLGTNTSQAWSDLTTDVSKAWTDTKKSITTVTDDISKDADTAWSNISTAASKIWGGIQTGLDKIGTKIKENAPSIGKWITGGEGPENGNIGGGLGEESDTINNFAYYSQADDRWAGTTYDHSPQFGTHSSNPTIQARGCGPTSMAMVLTQLTGKKYEPPQLAKIAQQDGFSSNAGTSWAFFDEIANEFSLGEQVISPTPDNIKSLLSQNIPVILSGTRTRYGKDESPFTTAGHFVVAVGTDGGDGVIINDPRGSSYSKTYDINKVSAEAAQGWGFTYSGGSTPAPDDPTPYKNGSSASATSATTAQAAKNLTTLELYGKMGEVFSNYVSNLYTGDNKQLDWGTAPVVDTTAANATSKSSSTSGDGDLSGYSLGTSEITSQVLALKPIVEKYAAQYGVSNKVNLMMAQIMQEAGGDSNALANDPMQAAEGHGLAPGALHDRDTSINWGVEEFANRLNDANGSIPLALQSYNFGQGFINYVKNHGGVMTQDLVNQFSDEQAVSHGWRGYGDKQYVQHVLRYYQGGGNGEIMLPITSALINSNLGGGFGETFGGAPRKKIANHATIFKVFGNPGGFGELGEEGCDPGATIKMPKTSDVKQQGGFGELSDSISSTLNTAGVSGTGAKIPSTVSSDSPEVRDYITGRSNVSNSSCEEFMKEALQVLEMIANNTSETSKGIQNLSSSPLNVNVVNEVPNSAPNQIIVDNTDNSQGGNVLVSPQNQSSYVNPLMGLASDRKNNKDQRNYSIAKTIAGGGVN